MDFGTVGTYYSTAMNTAPISPDSSGAFYPSSFDAISEAKGLEKSSGVECQTCKERKYVDGSNENVSFKSATHISPEAAGARVRAHEGEHVSNAYKKAAQGNGKVIRAAVSIHMATCPECGRSYVSGGTTRTSIQYSDETNPYQQQKKLSDRGNLLGIHFDNKV